MRIGSATGAVAAVWLVFLVLSLVLPSPALAITTSEAASIHNALFDYYVSHYDKSNFMTSLPEAIQYGIDKYFPGTQLPSDFASQLASYENKFVSGDINFWYQQEIKDAREKGLISDFCADGLLKITQMWDDPNVGNEIQALADLVDAKGTDSDRAVVGVLLGSYQRSHVGRGIPPLRVDLGNVADAVGGIVGRVLGGEAGAVIGSTVASTIYRLSNPS